MHSTDKLTTCLLYSVEVVWIHPKCSSFLLEFFFYLLLILLIVKLDVYSWVTVPAIMKFNDDKLIQKVLLQVK